MQFSRFLFLLSITCMSLITTCATHTNSTTQKEATDEINQIQLQTSGAAVGPDHVEQAVISGFAAIVQNFFNIVQAPQNSTLVGSNVAQMLTGIVNIAVEVMKGLSIHLTQEERVAYLNSMQRSLNAQLRSLLKEHEAA